MKIVFENTKFNFTMGTEVVQNIRMLIDLNRNIKVFKGRSLILIILKIVVLKCFSISTTVINITSKFYSHKNRCLVIHLFKKKEKR